MFEIGQRVKVPCQVSPGPFSEERLVTLETVEGAISGFVNTNDVALTDDSNGLLTGTVTAVEPGHVTVRLRGSFFTTNGLATVAAGLPIAA